MAWYSMCMKCCSSSLPRNGCNHRPCCGVPRAEAGGGAETVLVSVCRGHWSMQCCSARGKMRRTEGGGRNGIDWGKIDDIFGRKLFGREEDAARLMEEEEGDELSLSPFLIGTCVFGIITLLVGLTMAFEAMQEHLIHSSSKHMKPMISSLFGEMTILGFLSLVTYCISEAGLLKKISISVVDDSDEGRLYLTELFERVHYLLFTIMALFICQVLLLMHLAASTVSDWRQMNLDAQNPEAIAEWAERYLHPVARQWWDAGMASAQANSFFAFLSLRREFIVSRKTIHPFSLSDPSEHLPLHFDFAEYLSICLGDFLAHIIHLPPVTWGALWVLTVAFYTVYVALAGDIVLVSCAWVVVGLLNLLGVILLDKKCHKILSMLLNPSDFPRHALNFQRAGRAVTASLRFLPHAMQQRVCQGLLPLSPSSSRASAADSGERTGLLAHTHDELPAWTKITPRPPSGLFAWLGGYTLPNRHTALFWGGHTGPDLHMFLIRLHMIVLSVYAALVLAVFGPLLMMEQGYAIGGIYLLFSLGIVAWEFEFVLKDLITIMCQVSCCGMLRRNASIDEVIRKQKARRAMRALMMMWSLVDAAAGKKDCTDAKANTDDVLATVSKDEMNEIGNIFDMYDADGSGFIELSELKSVISSLGTTLTDEQAKSIYAFIDLDGDGLVSREEFITVYITKLQCKNMDRKTKAKRMFEMFDKDSSGSIMVSELVDGLRGLNHGLTTDDVVALAKELDENGDGEISLHEFEAIIEG